MNNSLTEAIRITDISNAIEEICDFIVKNRILLRGDKSFYQVCEGYLQPLSNDEAKRAVYSILPDELTMCLPSSQIDEVLRRLSYVKSIRFESEKLYNENQYYVNVKNGFFDIRNWNFHERNNTDRFDYMLNFSYIKDTTLDHAPHFKKYLMSSIGEDQIDCLLNVLGYCLSSLVAGRKAFVLLGKGKTGKSSILDLLEAVVGPEYVTHIAFHDMSNERSKAAYYGKRLNISREIANKPNKHEESFKSLISNEALTGNAKFEKPIDYVPHLTFIFAGNTDLCFGTLDDAIIDRLVYIIYDKEIIVPDPHLKDNLYAERDIIFSLALDKLPELVFNNYDFQMGEAGERHIEFLRSSIHSTESFISDECIISEDATVSSVELFNKYKLYCSKNGIDSLGQHKFYDKVRSLTNSPPNIKVRRTEDGNRVNGFKGIALK